MNHAQFKQWPIGFVRSLLCLGPTGCLKPLRPGRVPRNNVGSGYSTHLKGKGRLESAILGETGAFYAL